MSAFSVPDRDAKAGYQRTRSVRQPPSLGFPWLCGIGGQEAPPELTVMFDQAAAAVVTHASGRVWLFGTWSADQVLVVTVGAVQAIFLGTCRFRPAQAQEAVERGTATGSYDRLALLPGSFHLAVLTPAVAHLYGDTAGLRRLFHTQLGSVTVYADHALVLAELTGAAVDDARLATRLVCRVLDHVLDRIAPFAGVQTVPVAHRLTVDHDGRSTVAPYWRVPADDHSLTASAEKLRDQLTDAVETRVRPVQRVTCDLSGGLDSTALSFVACRAVSATDASLCTITCPAASRTSDNDDVAWAAKAVAAQPGAAHVFIDAEDYPLPYQDLDRVPALDERPASLWSWPSYAISPRSWSGTVGRSCISAATALTRCCWRPWRT